MSKTRDAFNAEFIRWRGRPPVGKFAHACPDWDYLPIDEQCPEWPCVCYPQGKKRGFGDTQGEPE